MKLIGTVILLLFFQLLTAQSEALYNPEADAEADLKAIIAEANKTNRHVLIQGGGNWCGWCREFARFASADAQIDSLIKADYIWYHLNYSKENRNEKVFADLEYPQRFGFPVFIILDGQGRRLHTQNSEYFEDGKKSYDKQKVMQFLKAWNSLALDPATYPSPSK